MKPSYLAYYERYRLAGMLRFIWDGLRTREPRRRLALMNRQRDYQNLAGHPELMPLHLEMNRHLEAAAREWPSYDYGEGYFYQGCAVLGISGLRNTEARVRALALRRRLAGRRVLEIGCNTGFVALSVADVARQVVGFDPNPHLIDIARRAAAYLGHTCCDFQVTTFESFTAEEPFDVVLSFANHATYDGNTRQTLDEYFARCHALTRPGGWLLFESHPPQHEGDGLHDVLRIIERHYEIVERSELHQGTFLDRGRTFVAARRPDAPAPENDG